MKVKNIKLVLENCETICIDGKYIGDILLSNFEESIKRIACNSISKMKIANTFVLEIHKDANKIYNSFGSDSEHPIFERLTVYPDITSFCIQLYDEYKDELKETEVEHYYVKWSSEAEYINKYQKSFTSDDGNLYIVISKDEGIDDYYDINELNDPVYMDYHFKVCEIGDKYSTKAL